ncbi:MAG: hypothetical protein PHR35_14005, partial [Kiritimatiellae bacterium]|nr:hypothetical protein [Kiritimatiellia bacterium]
GAFSLRNAVWADYDGLVWNTLTLKPKAKAALVSLEIESPLTLEFSDVTGGWGSTWLGNGDGGIQIYQEYTGYQDNPPGRPNPVRVEMENGLRTWRMLFTNGPAISGAPFDVALGFMATPARPKIVRTPMCDPRAITGGGAWFPPGLEYKPGADLGHDYYGGGGGGRLYIHTSPVNPVVDASGNDDARLYGAEWYTDPFGSFWNMTDIASKSFNDYFVWREWRYQQKYGLGGLYYDNPHREGLKIRALIKRMVSMLMLDPGFDPWTRTIGGASNGYLDLRYMSFWNYHWDGEDLNGAIGQWKTYIGHITPERYRAQYMGNNLSWPVMFLGQGRMRPEWVEAAGGNETVYDHMSGLYLLHDSGGGVCCILPGALHGIYSKRMQDAIDRHGIGHWAYQFLPYWHQDIVTLPSTNLYTSFYFARPTELADAAPEAIDAYFERYQTRCLPAFMRQKNRAIVAQSRPALAAMKDKTVMLVYNHSDWAGELRLKPDWKKIGLGAPADLMVENAVHRTGIRMEKTKDREGKETEQPVFFDRPAEYARIEGEDLVFPMTKWSYRMIVLEKKP